jgi:very-long-chain (3R)-3-hydroxyacyl-CoA dehydratase
MDNQIKARPKKSSSSKSTYLLGYNAVSFLLWSTVTLRAIVLIPALVSHDKLYGIHNALFSFLRATQTLALLEIAHATLGLVRASPFTTAMQVASRLMLVWGVLTPYPQIVVTSNPFGRSQQGTMGGPIALAGCHIAWGITEMIRYGFFVWKEGVSDVVPGWLMWLRYNTFFVLYPIGISSEVVLMYLAIEPAQDGKTGYDWVLKAVLAIYVPGSYILYTHMMAQRRKVMKGKSKAS